MKNTAQTIHASTQKFTEVRDIRDTIVLLRGGNACLIIEVTSVNFALLSPEEQDAKVSAYAALLNSLSFPVQILVRSKQIDIAPYIASLNQQAKTTTNPKLAENIVKYRDFIEKVVKTTTVLDKQFYFVIGYSSIEGSMQTASLAAIKEPPLDTLFSQAKPALETKADSLISEVERIGLKCKMLEKNALVKLFHDIYNEGSTTVATDHTNATIMTRGEII